MDKPRSAGVGDVFPSCRLVVLKGIADRSYLGLQPGAKSFALSDVPAGFLLVELYNELCSGCLKEVSSYNQLHRLIEDDPFLKGKLKMIGMGVGSLKRSVAKFRRKNKVSFPLFADSKREIFQCMGSPELPVLYLLKRDSGQTRRIVMVHSGHVGSPQKLLALVKGHMAISAP